MNEEAQKPLSLVEKMKLNLKKNKRALLEQTSPDLHTLTCPNCGAGRAKTDGLTKCAYCHFEFMAHSLTDGIHIKKTDNSAG